MAIAITMIMMVMVMMKRVMKVKKALMTIPMIIRGDGDDDCIKPTLESYHHSVMLDLFRVNFIFDYTFLLSSLI